MKRGFLTFTMVALITVALVISGCSSSATPAPAQPTAAVSSAPASSAPATSATSAAAPATKATTSAAAPANAPGEILIGATQAMTGDMAGFGQGNEFGLKAAIDDLNAQGGVMVKEIGKKLPMKLVLLDNESSPTKVGTLTEQLIVSNKVNFIVAGLLPPHLSAPAATVCEKYGIVNVTGCGPYEAWMELRKDAKPTWNHTWTSSFAIATPPDKGDFREGKLGFTIMDAWAPILPVIEGKVSKKIAAFASDDPDGRGWYLSFAPYMKEKGYEVYKGDKEFGIAPIDTNDFAPLIKEWKDAGCDTLWCNAPGPFFGTLWRQCATQGFKPKLVFASRAALFYRDVNSWGGDLPNGICTDMYWNPGIQDAPGYGGNTPKTLGERYSKATNEPFNVQVGNGYSCIQVIADAIERAGSLDSEKVNTAMATTDLKTVNGRISFNKENFSRFPCFFAQWQKPDPGKPYNWDLKIVVSNFENQKADAQILFPIPYK